MSEFFTKLFKADFMPHGHCYFWQPSILWLNVISDALIALAYVSIPLLLLYFVKKRQDLVFNWIFVAFAVFIIACGASHVMEIVNVWHGAYRITGVVKLITALASVSTAFILWGLIPAALKIPSTRQLEEANLLLHHEVKERKKAEEALMTLNNDLEDRIEDATKEQKIALANERAARSEAEKAGRMKDEFLSTLSHELRTPLNAVLGWVQMIRSGRLDDERSDDALAIIERNARSQAQIIEDLLDLSRIVSGKLQLNVQKVDLESVIERAIEAMRPAAEAKEIRIKKTIDSTIGPVTGDPSRLQQTFWNLLSNAIKFSDKGGQVDVMAERVDSRVEISVRDQGLGIGPEFLPFVFDRFRQADSTTTRKFGGLGIGLSIVKQLVELHGGSVRARSGGEGQGSTFTVSLPLEAVRHAYEEVTRHPTAPEKEDPVFSKSSLRIDGVKVLVVDDEPDARDLVRCVLEAAGAVTRTASSADEARALMDDFRPNVLISDIGMPQEDGYQFIRRLRQSTSEFASIPAVAVTAFARSEDRISALTSGYQMHIAKPIEAGELLAVIRTVAWQTLAVLGSS